MDNANIDGIQAIIDAIANTGRIYAVRSNEINLRCPMCGDSTKNQQHKHFYISTVGNHACYCQRCNFRSSYITPEVLEAIGATEQAAAVYVRQICKEQRRKHGRNKTLKSTIGGLQERLVIPQPSRLDPTDASVIKYLEDRIKGTLLSFEEIERYKIIACGLYGFLEANNLAELTVKSAEADRLNNTCIGFLAADESYIIFRSMDPDEPRRYTNYRIYQSVTGSKAFFCRNDIDPMLLRHRIVMSEGIIDLIQIERLFYAKTRMSSHHIGVATCGNAHGLLLSRLVELGFISLDIDLYLDNDQAGIIRKRDDITKSNVFLTTSEVKIRMFINSYRNEKDFGVPATNIQRTEVRRK